MSGALDGTTAVITGASRGIGLAIARQLLEAGARVAMLARGAEALSARAAELGTSAIPVPCDVSNAAAVERATGRLRELFGAAPDILVNNAGLFRPEPIDSTSVEALERSLEVNLVAPFLLVRAFLPAMRARGTGHVVNIGSVADHTTFPGNGAYAAAKSGLRALHEVLRLELRGTGVRATLVSPGPVDTPLWDALDPDSRAGFTPRAQMLPADAVAAAVRYAVTQPAAVNVDVLRLSRA